MEVLTTLVTPVTVAEVGLCIVICVCINKAFKMLANAKSEPEPQPERRTVILEVERKGAGWKYYPQTKQTIVLRRKNNEFNKNRKRACNRCNGYKLKGKRSYGK